MEFFSLSLVGRWFFVGHFKGCLHDIHWSGNIFGRDRFIILTFPFLVLGGGVLPAGRDCCLVIIAVDDYPSSLSLCSRGNTIVVDILGGSASCV